MRRIFKQQEVTKLAEPVKIPDAHFISKTNIIDEPKEQAEPECTDITDDSRDELESQTVVQVVAEQFKEREKEHEKKCSEMIAEAECNSKSIIEAAKVEAEEIINKAKLDKDEVLKTAFDEGTQKAIEQKSSEIDEVLSELAKNISELRDAQEEFFEKYSSELKMLAIDIAEKLLSDRIKSDETALLPLIKNTLKTMRDADYITVTISEKHSELIEKLKNDLPAMNMDKYTEIISSGDIAEDGIFIESPDSAIDASLSLQFENLREFFKQ